MKKIICLLLCLVFAVSMLASCKKDRIGDELDNSMRGYVSNPLTFNFYVIGDESNDNATVNSRIKNYCYNEFKTNLNVVYCNEADYSSIVTEKLALAKAAKDAGETDSAAINEMPHIFLINSQEMMTTLYENGYLADITEFYYPDIYEQRIEISKEKKNKFHAELIKNCEGLRNQIASTLIEASVIYEDIYNETTKQIETHTKHYCVPNNRVIGAYEYLLIHRDTAEKIGYIGSESQLAELKTWEDTAELRAKIEAKGLNVNDYVRIVYGKYEDKAMYEKGTYPGDDKKYACNIISYPEVAGYYDTVPADAHNVESVFESAYAVCGILDEDKDKAMEFVDRTMEIIYALNTDADLQNLLHYGVKDTNYTIDHIDQKTDFIDTNYTQIKPENKYIMNSKYTGNAFNLHDSYIWNEENKKNGIIQNNQSRLYKADN